jgi:hypothetical protein
MAMCMVWAVISIDGLRLIIYQPLGCGKIFYNLIIIDNSSQCIAGGRPCYAQCLSIGRMAG